MLLMRFYHSCRELNIIISIVWMYEGDSSIGKKSFVKATEGSIDLEYVKIRRQELHSYKLEW